MYLFVVKTFNLNLNNSKVCNQKNLCKEWNFKSNLYFDFYDKKGEIQIFNSDVKCFYFAYRVQSKMAYISDPTLTAAKATCKLFFLNISPS